MKRASLLLLCVVALSAAAGDDSQRIEVTGTVALPQGAKVPAKFRVEVDILKVEPGKVLTFLRPVGRLKTTTARSFPFSYSVACPKSVLKETPAKMFILRASVYELPDSGGSKLVYATPESDRTEALSANGEGRKDVLLLVKPVREK
jgi:hypothetical protein